MRLIHTCSGLLSIVGAAFLFAATHALIIGPVDIDPPAIKTDGPVKGDPNRVRSAASEDEPGQDQAAEPAETQNAPTQPEVRSLNQRPNPPAAEQPAQSPEQADPSALLDAPVPEGMLTLRQSHELWEQGAYFIDARHEHEFDEGHIQYAAWLTSTLFDTDRDRAFAVVESMPPNSTVVIYCVGGECDASKNVARRLEQLGFSDLRIMGVGYNEWAAAGLPVSEGDEP